MQPVDNENPPDEPHAPRVGLGAALLVIGGLAGWAIAVLGGGSTVTTTTSVAPSLQGSADDEIVQRDTRPPATINWTQATPAPTVPSGLEYAGVSNVVEIDDTMFVIFNFRNPATGETTSQIWQSPDGIGWFGEDIDVGEPIVGLHLAVSGDSLLVSGRSAGGAVFLRSIPARSIGGSSWTQASLPGADSITPEYMITAVATEGRVFTLATGRFDIWRRVIEPVLPPGVDLDDPRYMLRQDGTLLLTSTEDGVDSAEVIPLLVEPPEVVATNDAVWTRLVTSDGTEVLQTVSLPDGVYPTDSSPDLTDIVLAKAWIADDSFDFLEVTRPTALPNGLFAPEPWEDGFLAAVVDPDDPIAATDRLTFWSSTSGRAWRIGDTQPPPACSQAGYSFGGDRIHLTSADGTQCVREIGTEWEVLPDLLDATSTIGGDAGFITYPDSFRYDAGRFSRDGITWTDIEIPGLAPYPTLAVLDDRVVAISVDRPRRNRPTQIQLWVGEIS